MKNTYKAIENLLLNDEGINKGQKILKEDVRLADELVQDILSMISKKIDCKNSDIKLKHGLLALSRSMTYFCRYLYNNDEEYNKEISRARELVADKLILSLENPQPCTKCNSCKSNEPCENPIVESKNTTTKFITLIASAMIEYDNWCKTMYSSIKNSASNTGSDVSKTNKFGKAL